MRVDPRSIIRYTHFMLVILHKNKLTSSIYRACIELVFLFYVGIYARLVRLKRAETRAIEWNSTQKNMNEVLIFWGDLGL